MTHSKQCEKSITDLEDMAFDKSSKNIRKHKEAVDSSIQKTLQNMLFTLLFGGVATLVLLDLTTLNLFALIIFIFTLIISFIFFNIGVKLAERYNALEFIAPEDMKEIVREPFKDAQLKKINKNAETKHPEKDWAKNYIYNIVNQDNRSLTHLEHYHLNKILLD